MSIGYHRPASIAEAAALCAGGGRILAGGQSLMPLVNRGAIEDIDLIDINRLDGLDGIVLGATGIEIGALARLEAVRRHPVIVERLPMLSAALAWVGNPAIRRRGTLVGNLVQNGPGAEAVAVAALARAGFVAADGSFYPLGGLPAAAFATHVRLDPSPAGTRAAFVEVQRRFGHLGTVGCGVSTTPDGTIEVVYSGLVDDPLVARAVASALAGGRRDTAALEQALAVDLAGRVPRTDLHADAAYRLAVAPVLAARVMAHLEAAR